MKLALPLLLPLTTLALNAAAPLNFVLIVSDELPPEYIGAYGGKSYPTPNLDRLAADGQRFTQAFTTAPMCTPARYSVMTGRYPGRCQATAFQKSNPSADQPYIVTWNTKIDAKEKNIARHLTDLGYNTGLVGKWHLGPLDEKALEKTNRLPVIPSNTRLEDPATSALLAQRQSIIQDIVRETAGFTHARNVHYSNAEEEPLVNYHNIPAITRSAVEMLRTFAETKKPFLLVTTPTAVHGPWHPDSLDRDLRYTVAGYVEDVYKYAPDQTALRTAIASLSSGEKHKHVGMVDIDHHVGRIRAELERLNLAESTVIIYTADHGIEPGKASVYDRGLRVPLIIYWPNLTNPSAISEALAQHTDIAATIATTAGVANVEEEMDGVDLCPNLENTSAIVRDYAYFECGFSRAITDGRYKYIAVRLPQPLIQKAEAGSIRLLTVGMGEGRGAHAAFSQLAYPAYYEPDQLYDLHEDPYEMHTRWNDKTLAAQQIRLRQALKRVTANMPHAFPLAAQPFFKSAIYRELSERTKKENNPNEYEPWVKRDHDAIIWPPEKSIEKIAH